MALDLLSNTILWPLLLGALLAGLLLYFGPRDRLLAAIAALMLLVIYARLEGMPAFPPVGAKQKLSYLLLATALIALAAHQWRWPLAPVAAGLLLIALVWLGWNKLTTAAAWPQSAALLAPVAAGVFASHHLDKHSPDAFRWPSALLVFTAGAAILSLFGAFVGFAQALGAMAAWFGGFLLIRYGVMLIGRGTAASLPPAALLIMLISAVLLVLMIGLFAPNISVFALIVLSGSLVVPPFIPLFERLPKWITPFLTGLMAALPAALSVLIAFQLRD